MPTDTGSDGRRQEPMPVRGERKIRRDFGKILDEIAGRIKPQLGKGRVAAYIPALARVPARKFGMAITTVDGDTFSIGDASEPFSIQSVSKVFTLALALERVGTKLWRRVGLEPSGNPFNSLVQLEYENGIPRNPFINAGALVVTDTVVSTDAYPNATIRAYMQHLSANTSIDFDDEVVTSERNHGNRNAALAHFLKSHNNLHAPVDAVLDTYFHQCGLRMSCIDLARATLSLANGGMHPDTAVRIMSARRAKRINAVMMTCGLYDAVGNFAYRVGIPAKSGVGGGIIGVIPGELSVCVWAPGLDRSGNSLAGTAALELLTTKTGLSVF